MNTTPNKLTEFIIKWKTALLFVAILGVGIFSRVWEFGSLPPGLNPDEASIGVEAYDLFNFGVDRYGLSYPVHLISWGSGQNALYAYLLIPFIALRGVGPVAVRFPMMLSGILSLPLIFIAGKKMFGTKFALLAMFFMAISPWHIINTRWAVESNIMPFFFLAGFTALALSTTKNWWYLPSFVFFALCLYAYGTAYVGVPVFLFLMIPVMFHTKRMTMAQAITGLAVFALIAAPIILFIAVNTLHMETLHLGLVTIPRLPVEARYETMAAIFGENPLSAIWGNTIIMFKMLWTQEDAFPWNFVAPFGYFYKFTLPLAAAGFILTMPFAALKETRVERWFIFSWVVASLAIGMLHPVNLTRLNLIFTPILLCVAILILKLEKHIPLILPVTAAAFSIGFILFTQAYHGDEYQRRTSALFNEGILPAIEFASQKSDSLICFTEQRYSLYIYVLLAQKYHPAEYVSQLDWIDPLDPADPARIPRAINNYRFKLEDCANTPEAVYILTLKEEPPLSDVKYTSRKFEKFLVYLPR